MTEQQTTSTSELPITDDTIDEFFSRCMPGATLECTSNSKHPAGVGATGLVTRLSKFYVELTMASSGMHGTVDRPLRSQDVVTLTTDSIMLRRPGGSTITWRVRPAVTEGPDRTVTLVSAEELQEMRDAEMHVPEAHIALAAKMRAKHMAPSLTERDQARASAAAHGWTLEDGTVGDTDKGSAPSTEIPEGDIVTNLRHFARVYTGLGVMDKAADEIERLRIAEAALVEQRATNARLNRRAQIAEAAVNGLTNDGMRPRLRAERILAEYWQRAEDARAELAALKAAKQWKPTR